MKQHLQTLHAQHAFITGASKGIGYAIAAALVQQGVNVAITARNADDIKAATESLSAYGSGKVLGFAVDVRDIQALQHAAQDAAQQFGGLDVVIANAGVGRFAAVQDLTLEQWQDVIDTNLNGVFYTLKATLPQLTASQGYFISISSLAAKNPFAGGSAYNASKFGLRGFSEAIMLDLRPLGIKVSSIMPGSVATHFNGHTPSPADAWKIQPEDIATLVLDLLAMNPRTLPSAIEVRPSQPQKKA